MVVEVEEAKAKEAIVGGGWVLPGRDHEPRVCTYLVLSPVVVVGLLLLLFGGSVSWDTMRLMPPHSGSMLDEEELLSIGHMVCPPPGLSRDPFLHVPSCRYSSAANSSSKQGAMNWPSFLPPPTPENQLASPLYARLFLSPKGRAGGLWVDAAIYYDLLKSMGYIVELINIAEQPGPEPNATCMADIQVFFEHPRYKWIKSSRYNVLNVNQDIKHDTSLYWSLDAIIAKSHYAKQLVEEFKTRNNKTAHHRPAVYYIGHTSRDKREDLECLPPLPKNYSQFVHVGGWSTNKNTEMVYATWRKHREWPALHLIDSKFSHLYFNQSHAVETTTDSKGAIALAQSLNCSFVVVQENLILYRERLTDEQLLTIQQIAGVHVCPSLEEGFGHYINEARALGALIMTSDWPPMNELVRDYFGLILPCKRSSKSRYGAPLPGTLSCVVFPPDLADGVHAYTDLMSFGSRRANFSRQASTERVRVMGDHARRQFEVDRAAFHERVRMLFLYTIPNKLRSSSSTTTSTSTSSAPLL